eukprot:UC1_evm1s677
MTSMPTPSLWGTLALFLLLALAMTPCVVARARVTPAERARIIERAVATAEAKRLSKLTVKATTTTVATANEKVGGDDAVYWWVLKQKDCAYDDIRPKKTCNTIKDCEALCSSLWDCGGFNTHWIMKKTNCESHISTSPTVDLYLKKSTPQPPPPPPPPPAVNFPPIWPLPAEYANGTANVTVSGLSSFTFKAGTASPDLTLAFQRYAPLFFPHKTTTATTSSSSFSSAAAGANAGVITGVEVNVKDVSGDLQLETNESYVLTVPASGSATISAPTVFGAMHGLETLSQLISFDFDTETYTIASAPWVITDRPRFKHRELLVDSARHFEPVKTLKAVIDSLTYAKINVVHWHIVDQQSFPFDAPSLPKLAQAGAFSPQERFTAMDISEVVEYARARGVRVMPEIDTPGHAASWCKGHPEICPSPTCPEPLNPATEATFDLLAKLFGDITGGARGKGLFPDNMFHLGGDEVNTACWTQSESISKWLRARNLTADGGYAYFVNRTQAIARGFGREPVVWEEVWDHFGTKLDKSIIIHQWLPGSTIAKDAAAAGYRVLWSTDGVWYLDGLGTSFETMYEAEPCEGIPDDLCASKVRGGGGEQWGETVDTSDIEQTVWPRLGAIAERLWSPRDKANSADAARKRYAAFRCLLNRR